MKKKIAIIGAGIAGLTLANLIKKNSDFEFMLFEKEESLSLDEGFGIQLATNSVSILNKVDFKKIDSENIFHPKNIDFFTIKNEKICDLEISKFNSEYSKWADFKFQEPVRATEDLRQVLPEEPGQLPAGEGGEGLGEGGGAAIQEPSALLVSRGRSGHRISSLFRWNEYFP